MKKHIYITEEIAKEITALVNPLTELPKDIKNVLRNHKTSLGMHPAFPPDEEMSFDEFITNQRFKEVCDKVKKLNLENYSSEYIQKHIQKLMNECKDIEKNFKTQLEHICYNYIIDLFQVPEGLVAFSCKLVDNVNDNKASVKKYDTIEFSNINQRRKLHDAVYKRRLINAIITGGAMRLSFISKDLIGELYELSPKLPELYRNIIILNEYLLFTKNNIGISEKNKKQSGISYVTIGNEITKNQISVEAEIFPILLHESIRGFLEMFAAYGLPSEKIECAYVMQKADFINAEPWDMRIGPALWDIIIQKFGEPKNDELPLLLTILFSQRNQKFNMILQEFFGDTRLGEELAHKIYLKAVNELEGVDFEDIMRKKQTETTIINDNYFKPEEL